MRTSLTVVITKIVIIGLSGIATGLELLAILNDLKWNGMKEDVRKRFTPEEYYECNYYYTNYSTPSQYHQVFTAKMRDMPLELPFLILTGASFVINLFILLTYLLAASVDTGIWLCIIWHAITAVAHAAATVLIVISTLIYSDPGNRYQGSKLCYPFTCEECPPEEQVYSRARLYLYYLEARECLENLSVCQLSGMKDRNVYLLGGCFVGSVSIVFSSCQRLQRIRRNRIRPKSWICSTKCGPDEVID